MTDVSISLSNIVNKKKIRIEEIGDFTVRKMGAGEELDLSKKMRRLGDILDKLEGFDFTKFDMSKPEDVQEVAKLQKQMTKLSDEITDIKRFEFETYKRCFEDDNDGKNVDKLMNELPESARAELFRQIFQETEGVTVDKAVTPEAEDEGTS